MDMFLYINCFNKFYDSILFVNITLNKMNKEISILILVNLNCLFFLFNKNINNFVS